MATRFCSSVDGEGLYFQAKNVLFFSAGADVGVPGDSSGLRFKYPSYVQDIMG